MSKFILRFDDITPGMDWNKFLKIKEVAVKYGIKSILGVVPDNKDANLSININMSNSVFFSTVKEFAEYGDTIAQHGIHHTYTIKAGGMLGINEWSEFAGHSYEVQLERLQIGKNILSANSIWQPYFMAPSHSFDRNTLKALKKLGFTAITDGYGLYPYNIEGVILVPQLLSKPLKFLPFGIQTICLHTNSISDDALNYIINFIENNHDKFIDFKEAINIQPKFSSLQLFTHMGSKYSLKIIRMLRRII